MEFTDILGFAAIIGCKIEENKPFEDFITSIVEKFINFPRKERREILKLARDVVGANKLNKKEKESQI